MRRAIAATCLTLALLFPRTSLTAQTGSMRVTVPSPTAASLGKFGDIPVSYYTGVPDITIPLFTVKGKTLQLPIALRYHASGLRVEDIGGWVGMGWALDAGGVITRTVRGVFDDRNNGYYYTGYAFYDEQNWANPWPNLLLNIDNHATDGEPDQFFFDFAGKSGEFVAGPTTTSQTFREFRAIPYQKWVIQPTLDASGRFTAWLIRTEDGTQYRFAAKEMHTDWSPPGDFDAYGYGNSYASSWYLTEIRAPGGDVITLQYQAYNAGHAMGRYREQWDDKGGVCIALPPWQEFPSYYEVNAQKLVSITSAAHTVTFTNSLRSDAKGPSDFPITSYQNLAQEPRLDTIIIKTRTPPAGTVLRRFLLDYDYTIGGRLTLKNVFEQDSFKVALPPYSFTYNPIQLPARTSYAIDHWGYYNGSETNTSYIPPGVSPFTGTPYPGANRNPDPAFMQAGVLTRITYPTGGYNDFTYQANDYSWVGGTMTTEMSKPAGGLRVAEIDAADGMGHVTVRKYFYTSGTYSGRSSGVIQAEPKYDYPFQGTDTQGNACSYWSRSSRSKMALGSGPMVGYNDVTEWSGTTGEYGKTRRTFTTMTDPNLPEGTWPYLRRTSYEYQRGLEASAAEYNTADQMQRRLLSTYQFPEPVQTTRKFRGIATSSVGGQWGTARVLTWNKFFVQSVWRYKDSETTTVCDPTGSPCFSTSKTFVYGNPNHAQLTELQETNSDGTQRITRMRYPGDYIGGAYTPEAAALTAMQDTSVNIQNAVIERWAIKRVGATDVVVQAELTTWKNFAVSPAPPQYRPFQHFVLNSPNPLP